MGVRWRARDTGIVELTLFVEGRVRAAPQRLRRAPRGGVTAGAQLYGETLLRAGPPMTFGVNNSGWRVGLGYSCQYCGDERWGYFYGTARVDAANACMHMGLR